MIQSLIFLLINLHDTKPYFSSKKQGPLGAQYIDSSNNDNKQDCEDENKKETIIEPIWET